MGVRSLMKAVQVWWGLDRMFDRQNENSQRAAGCDFMFVGHTQTNMIFLGPAWARQRGGRV